MTKEMRDTDAMCTSKAAFATRRSGVRASSRPPANPVIPEQNTPHGRNDSGRDGLYAAVCVRIVHAAFTLLVLFGGSASAQDLGRYKLPVVLLAGAATVDIGSTLMMAHYNQVRDPTFRSEKNPIVGWMEPRIGTPGMLAVGAAIEVTAMLVACKLLCKQHPTLMKWGLLTGAAVHGATTTSNLRIHYGPH